MTAPWAALAISSAAYIAVGFVATTMAGRQRAQVKTMAATVSAGYPDAHAAARRDQLGRLALTLMNADERLGRGQISAADHELTWWRVYDEIGSKPTACRLVRFAASHQSLYLPVGVDGTVQRQSTVGEYDLSSDPRHFENGNDSLRDVVSFAETAERGAFGQPFDPSRQLFGLVRASGCG